MRRRTHYQHQLSYFGKEFSQIQEYKLKPWHRTYIERIKKTILDEDIDNKTLIDVGTGAGYVAVEMARFGLNIIACDLTSEALGNIKRFKKQFSLLNIRLIECKADEIPVGDNSVDYVVANAILEHLPDDRKAAEEWKRILKPKGKLFLTAPLKYKYIWPFFIPLNYIHDKRIGHLRRYDINSLKRLFKMKVLGVFYTGHFIKMIGFIISVIFRISVLDEILEHIDKKMQDRKYGATNIIMVFGK